ncbi:MAG: hypothetical protein ACK56F_19905, partial [bacterium]
MREDTCSTPTYVVSSSPWASWLGPWDGCSCIFQAFLRPPLLKPLLAFSGLPAFLFWPLRPVFRLASLGVLFPSPPVDRTDPTGLASLA